MRAKEYLSQIEILERKAHRAALDVNKCRQLAVSIGIDTSKEYVQSSGDKDTVGSAAIKILDAEREAEDHVRRYVERKKIIIRQIEEIGSQDYADVLFYRYVEYMTFQDLASVMHYSERQIYRMHDKALAVFDEKYNAFYA